MNKKSFFYYALLLCAITILAGCKDDSNEPTLTPEQELKNKLKGDWESIINVFTYNPPESYKTSCSVMVHVSFTDDSVKIVGEQRIMYSTGAMHCNYARALTYGYKMIGENCIRTKRCWSTGYTEPADTVIHEIKFISPDSVELTNFYDEGGICRYDDMVLYRNKEKK